MERRYDSFYVVEGFADVVPDDTVPGEPFAGTLVREEGTFVANVDLDTARISGGDTRFVLDGTLSGQIMSGNVTFEGLEGDLIGKVGPSLLFGGFIIETPDAALGGIVRGSPLP